MQEGVRQRDAGEHERPQRRARQRVKTRPAHRPHGSHQRALRQHGDVHAAAESGAAVKPRPWRADGRSPWRRRGRTRTIEKRKRKKEEGIEHAIRVLLFAIPFSLPACR